MEKDVKILLSDGTRILGNEALKNNDQDLEVQGKILDPALLYNLHTGANLISFCSNSTIEVKEALPDNIESEVVGIITSDHGKSGVAIFCLSCV